MDTTTFSLPNLRPNFTVISSLDNQLIFPLGLEFLIGEDHPVRFVRDVLETLDYAKFYVDKPSFGQTVGKPSKDPKLMTQVIAYAHSIRIYSARDIEDACNNRVDFLWLLNGEKLDHTTITRFINKHDAAIEDIFYQFTRWLDDHGYTDHEVTFVDGTKLESVAGRYTFVWRGTVEKNLDKLLVKVANVFAMRDIYLENTLDNLHCIVENEKKAFNDLGCVYVAGGRGHHKSSQQKELEEITQLEVKWREYLNHLQIMGPNRNSYSKTDPDATFMRMKDDHMQNGQLKPGYNIQIGINSEFVTGFGVFPDRNDTHTLIPLLNKMEEEHGVPYEAVATDAGYGTFQNRLYLESESIKDYIKPPTFDQEQTNAFQNQIGRRENMAYDAENDRYTCAEGRFLNFSRETTITTKYDVKEVVTYYQSASCIGCPESSRSKCCKAKDADTPKEISINKELVRLADVAKENLNSDQGIVYRVNRSIQVEGAFGVTKYDMKFDRLECRGFKKVKTKLAFFFLGFDLRKLKNKDARRDPKRHLFVPKSIEK